MVAEARQWELFPVQIRGDIKRRGMRYVVSNQESTS
jgi:hypothetical protein